ncbi:MAG: hypothetical protein JSS02_16270 [Planctomycetes bacterium]|nr:hypothetical protein [Planctomycetota bacterium]
MTASLILTVALLSQISADDSKPQSIRHGHHLTDHDWGNDSRIVSLRPGKKWSSGAAWFFRLDHEMTAAWKGTYRIFEGADKSGESILVSFAFTRRYVGTWKADKSSKSKSNPEVLDWELTPRFVPIGMELEIPLDDGAIPDDCLKASVLRGFYVDDNGKETTLYHEPEGLLNNLVGKRQEKKIRILGCANVGETLTFSLDHKRRDFLAQPEDHPPTFRPHEIFLSSEEQRAANYRQTSEIATAIDAEIRNQLSDAVKNKDWALVLNLAEMVLKDSPNDHQALRYRAQANDKLGNRNKHLEDLTRKIEANPADTVALRGRVFEYIRLERYSAALQDYEALIAANPNSAYDLNGLAWLLATCPDKSIQNGKRAVELATKACKATNCDDWMCLDTLAAAHARAGDFQKAQYWQNEALKRGKSESSPDKDQIAKAKARLRDYEMNRAYVEK